ncbi:ribosomal RNA small subunit methyltransferase A [Clostridia bacterium]|nr:ribosomal RNA small subunit methyltransferase A [Clostridia bacterium]
MRKTAGGLSLGCFIWYTILGELIALDTNTILKAYNLRAMKAFGQNFLRDTSIVERIAEISGADGRSRVVEVGAGLGILTSALAQRAAKVVALELDRRLKPALDLVPAVCPNAEIIFADALKADFAALTAGSARSLFCANLPYHITTPILTLVLNSGCFERVTVMVQREVALRLAAKAGTADYGAFSVFCQNRADVEVAFEVPPTAFIPPPKVTSAVVTMDVTPLKFPHPKLESVVRASFAQRRKQLINALPSGLGITREGASDALKAAGIAPTARGETLSLERFAALTDAIYPA